MDSDKDLQIQNMVIIYTKSLLFVSNQCVDRYRMFDLSLHCVNEGGFLGQPFLHKTISLFCEHLV